MNYRRIIYLALLTCISHSVLADPYYACPSVKAIKKRDISKEFDWTVSEEITLAQVINVTELLDVTIENQGEFVACGYRSGKGFVRLDAKPITIDCLIVPNSNNWLNNKNGQFVCNDDNKLQCTFNVSCQFQPEQP